MKFAITLVNTVLGTGNSLIFVVWWDQRQKRNIVTFNDLLYTQRETWGNWWMIHANPRVSFSTGTSWLNRHTHDSTVNCRKRKLAISSITILVHCLGASFAFAWQKKQMAQRKIFDKKIGRKTAHNNLYDPVKTPLISSIINTTTSHPSLRINILSSNPPSVKQSASHPSLSTDRLHPTPPWVLMVCFPPIKWPKKKVQKKKNGPKHGPKNGPKIV